FGVVTIYVLVSYGIIIGTITGYLISQGHGETFLSFVISHGAFELTAIAIAGGAGLMLGNAVLHPGQRTRLENLQVQGREAVQIAGGAVVMLMIAALIEAFWSPAAIPVYVKFTVGGVLWLLVALYLSVVGREVIYGSEVLVTDETETQS
ncbi:MAG: stage II sporulation protein M, partial [Planctomycetaceae bacterium]|nr:stage II sporulation protein M [Planctomycetaceae bacterium]